MKKRVLQAAIVLILLFLVVLVVRPASIIEPAFQQPQPKKDITMVALGDSLTKGVGDTENKGYVGDVSKRLKKEKEIGQADVYNYGIKGDTSDDLLEKLHGKDVINRVEDADLIVFTIGGNDMMDVVKHHFFGLKRKTFEKKKKHYQKNLNQVFKILRKHNDDAQIVYVGVFNPFSRYFSNMDEAKQIIADWTKAGRKTTDDHSNTAFVPIYDIFANHTEGLLSDDHFHPNDQGYELIGKRVMRKVDMKNILQGE